MTTNLDLADARRVFYASQDIADISPASVAEAVPGVNTKYAHQILAALTKVGLLYETSQFDRGTHQGYYWEQGEEQAFNEAFNLSTNPSKEHTMTTNANKTTADGKCNCGCGFAVPAKRLYRPGHDARHASIIARDVAKTFLASGEAPHSLGIDPALPTPALRTKAFEQVLRLVAKGQPKAKDGSDSTERASRATASTSYQFGTAKIGRWDYPARKRPNGRTAQVNTQRDGKGTWKALDLAKFVPAAN